MSAASDRPHPSLIPPALVVLLGGVAAGLHIGKLPPAIPALQQALGLSLLQAGFLLSLVQGAGMCAGVAFGALADSMGLRRSMLLGLTLLALASTLGGLSDQVALLLALRALEGFGFLLTVLAAPALLRRLVAPERLNLVLGLWGAYMPLATACALLAGPLWIAEFGWRSWWWLLAALSAATALWLARAVPALGTGTQPISTPSALPLTARLRQTLGARGPWLAACAFACYSGQWLAVIGFLPAIYTQAGVSGAATGVLTALVAGVNMVGNIASGRLLYRGRQPSTLLAAGYLTMGVAALLAFAGGADGAWLPGWLRYAAVLAFSAVGGLVPGTLFTVGVRLAPGEQTVSTTLGWIQQWSAFGQFAGPPLVAAVAASVGGWQLTWVVTGACSLAGLLLTAVIRRQPALAAG